MEIVITYNNPDNLDSMKIAQLAAEDDSNRAIPTSYHLNKLPKEEEIHFNSDFIAPLNEGDFWLPAKNLAQSKKIDYRSSIISGAYYQRMSLGNSKVVKSTNQLHSSTLFLEKKDFQSVIFDVEKVSWINEPFTVVIATNANKVKKTIKF